MRGLIPLTFKSVPVTVTHHGELAEQINEPCVGRYKFHSLWR
jgi:hypothetical protein